MFLRGWIHSLLTFFLFFFSPFFFPVLSSSTAALHPRVWGKPGVAGHWPWEQVSEGRVSYPPGFPQPFSWALGVPLSQQCMEIMQNPKRKAQKFGWGGFGVCVHVTAGGNCHISQVLFLQHFMQEQRQLHEQWRGTNPDLACSPNKYVHEQLNR